MNRKSYPSIPELSSSRIYNNGLRAFTVERHESPVITVQAWVATGSLHEEQDSGCGLSHFLEHMMFQNEKVSVAEQIAKFGGNVNAYTSFDKTVFHITLPSKNWKEALTILVQMLRNPPFPEKKFLSEREVILRECAMYDDNGASVFLRHLLNSTFLTHPARYPIIGYQDKISAVTREQMAAYHARRYTPGRTFFLAAGDVEPELFFDALEKLAGDWSRGNLEEPFLPPEDPCLFARHTSFTFKEPVVRAGSMWQIPCIAHAAIPALEIYTDIFGNSDSSRLYEDLVNQTGIALDSSTFMETNRFFGCAGFISVLQPEKVSLYQDRVRALLEEFHAKGPSQQELKRAIALQKADYLHSLDTATDLAKLAGGTIFSFGTLDPLDSYLDRLEAVTAEDVVCAGKTWFDPEHAVCVEQFPSEMKRKTERKIPVKFPEMTMKVRRNGLRSLHLERRSGLIYVDLVFPGTAETEKGAAKCASLLIAETLCASNAQFSEKEFNRLLDDHAVDLSTEAKRSSFRIEVSFPKEEADPVMKLLNAMLKAPLFEEKILERERITLMEEAKLEQMQPRSAAKNLLFGKLFRNVPAPVSAKEKLDFLPELDRKTLQKIYFEKMLNPEAVVVGFGGGLTRKEADRLEKKLFDGVPWKNNGKFTWTVPAPPVRTETFSAELDREQSIILTGTVVPDMRAQPESLVFQLLQSACSSMDSRLFRTIRDDAGLAYYTGLTYYDCGPLLYYTGTCRKNADKVQLLTEQEIRRTAKQGLTRQEFANAKTALFFSLDNAEQNAEIPLLISCLDEFSGNGWQNRMEKRKQLEALSFEETNRILKRILGKSHFITVRVLGK